MQKIISHPIWSNIRFWIVLLFIIRLYGITNPPLENSHNWRQTTVTMVARNFQEVDNNILYPRIDIAGEKTGITGMEFPILNYMIYAVSEVFGYTHWYGRLINLIVSSFGLWFFFLLVQKYFTKQQAFYATLLLAFSIWFQFSRKIMPDTFSMSFVIAAIYYGCRYFETKVRKLQVLNLTLYLVLMMVGILSKLPSGYLLVVFVLFYFDKEISLQKKVGFAMVSIVGILPVAWWYFIWVPYLVDNYGFEHFFMGKSIGQGMQEIWDRMPRVLSRFYDTATKISGFIVFVFGVYMSFKTKNKVLLRILGIGFIAFLVIILKAGRTFPMHSYYIVPFVPIMALVMAYGLSQLKNKKIAAFLIFAVATENIIDQHYDFRIKDTDKPILSLEQDLNQFSKPSDLILINSGEFPTPMYFAHRKGWVDTEENILTKGYLEQLKQKGLKYIVILKKSFGSPIKLENYKPLLENENYTIYSAQ